MRVLGLVPARGGSERIPRKNLAVIGGRTLVRRALGTAVASGVLDQVILSSEDEEILAEADEVPEARALPRPPELATSEARTYDVVVDVLDRLDSEGVPPFDAVAVLQCTSPFTAPEDIRGAVEMLERTGGGSVVSIVEVTHENHPLKLKHLEGNRLLPFYEDDRLRPWGELPEVFVRNGCIFLSRREEIGDGSLLSDDVRGYLMPRERSLDINDPLDLEFARFLAEREGALRERG